MLFDIILNGTAIASGLTENDDAIALPYRGEGAPVRGEKHPKSLDATESTRVRYPLIGREIVATVTRTE